MGGFGGWVGSLGIRFLVIWEVLGDGEMWDFKV